jgi:hypothetical protein
VVTFLHFTFGRLHVRLFVPHDLRTEKRKKISVYKRKKKRRKCGGGKEQDLLQVYVPHPQTQEKKRGRGGETPSLHEATSHWLHGNSNPNIGLASTL